MVETAVRVTDASTFCEAGASEGWRLCCEEESSFYPTLGFLRTGRWDLSARSRDTTDKQANDDVVQLDRFGKAEPFAREPVDTDAQRQMLPVNLLGIAFPRHMSFGSEMQCIRPPVIGEETPDPKRLQQGFELQKHVIYDRTNIPEAKALLAGLGQPLIEVRTREQLLQYVTT
jgi:hypothetical protein